MDSRLNLFGSPIAGAPPSTTTRTSLALVCVIALINAYNRVNVVIQQPAGDYQPGQFG